MKESSIYGTIVLFSACHWHLTHTFTCQTESFFFFFFFFCRYLKVSNYTMASEVLAMCSTLDLGSTYSYDLSDLNQHKGKSWCPSVYGGNFDGTHSVLTVYVSCRRQMLREVQRRLKTVSCPLITKHQFAQCTWHARLSGRYDNMSAMSKLPH